MSGYRLISPADGAGALARVFLDIGVARIEVLEGRCFRDGRFWPLGDVNAQGQANDPYEMHSAVSKGAYEWQVPRLQDSSANLKELLDIQEPAAGAKSTAKEQYQKTLDRLDRIMDAVATSAVRVGLTHPILDPISVEEMPFRRATTVIADTSGALQGGLDFVARFLNPAARIKVPAIVHMEIVNQADSFLKRRRAPKINPSALLFDHMLSQAGQRVLLRLEFREDTEVERTLLIGDPLRNAFQRDGEQEWTDLNLSVPLRSYCDRLIIEAARQHQGQASPGHPIQLLTSDQGFARMALAEGIAPLYFRAVSARSFFGRRLTGMVFHPFTAHLYRVPLQLVLWELATAFGAARLISPDSTRWVEIVAIGEELAWSPIHSRNDLLWMRTTGLPDLPEGASAAPTSGLAPARVKAPVPIKTVKSKSRARLKARADLATGVAFYRINPGRMLQLVSALARDGQMDEAKAMRIVSVESKSAFSEYKRFLIAGEFARTDDDRWTPTDAGLALAQALDAGDLDSLASELARVPSVKIFLEDLRRVEVGTPVSPKLPERAETTYRTLGELVCEAAPIAKEGYYVTPSRPKLDEFAEIALQRFSDLDTGDGFVSVGTWLELLVRVNGIHPERARRYLDEASASGLIVRSTEGSTTDTRHDQHAIQLLRVGPSGPRVETVHLYRGDFLVPNKSSSSIRLGRPKS